MPKVTLGELAGAIGARLEGDPAVEVTGVARLEDAGPEDLSFLANPRYEVDARESAAAAIVVGDGYRSGEQNILRTENPYLAFARAVELITPSEPLRPGVAETAVVDPSVTVPADASIGPWVVIERGVELGAGVAVGAGTVIEARVEIGDGSRIGPRVTVHRGTSIGERCIVQSGAVLGSEGYGYATDKSGRHHPVPQRGGLVIGDDVDIGANVTIDRGSIGDTVIGSGTKIDNLVHVAHNVRIGKNAIIVAQVGIAGSTQVGDYVVLGGQAGLQGHIRVGDRARIGGQAGVIGDVPADAELSGYPARPHREQMRAYALFTRLPEFFDRLKALESRLRRP